MKHIFQKGSNLYTFVLLHGTGGNESDLLSLAKYLEPSYNVLGIRGNILENGMPRFFKRLAFGVFDEENLIEQTNIGIQFLTEAVKHYELDGSKLIALGYSNGANYAASILFHQNDVFQKAILFHAMDPLQKELPDLSQTDVFIGAGKFDSMVPIENTERLAKKLVDAGASVEVFWTNQGHQLSKNELDAAKKWLHNKQK